MAVVTKLKISANGKMTAGQFEETDVNSVTLGADSSAKVSSLDESGQIVKFTADGKIIAAEFEEV